MDCLIITKKIVRLASDLMRFRDKSFFTLLMESGYAAARDKITHEAVKKELCDSPEYVKEWLQYSENKRTASGWYFSSIDNNTFEVAFLAENGQVHHRQTSSDVAEICAIFIRKEVESVLNDLSFTKK